MSPISDEMDCRNEEGDRLKSESIEEARLDGWFAASPEDSEKLMLEGQRLRRELKKCQSR